MSYPPLNSLQHVCNGLVLHQRYSMQEYAVSAKNFDTTSLYMSSSTIFCSLVLFYGLLVKLTTSNTRPNRLLLVSGFGLVGTSGTLLQVNQIHAKKWLFFSLYLWNRLFVKIFLRKKYYGYCFRLKKYQHMYVPKWKHITVVWLNIPTLLCSIHIFSH